MKRCPREKSAQASDERFMSMALAQAKKALKAGEVPIGCVIADGGKIVSRGYNTREKNDDPTGHAEINAIRKASKKRGDYRLSDTVIYVTVEPCMMCLGAILQARIPRIVYGCKNPNEGAVSLLVNAKKKLAMNYKVDVVGNVLAKESLSILRDFFKCLRCDRK